MEVLHLPIKRKWFDMIASGEKTEEYREIKGYWARRFLYFPYGGGLEWQAWEEMLHDLKNPLKRHNSVSELLKYFGAWFRLYDVVKLRNGYAKDAPELLVEFKGIQIQQGREEWGAEKNKFYFTIYLGNKQ